VLGGLRDGWIYLGMTLLVLSVAAAMMGTATARHGSSAAIVATLAYHAVLLVVTSAIMPGATFAFLWPLLLLLAAWTATMRMETEALANTVALLYALPMIVLLAPLGDLLFQGLALERSLFHAPLLGLWLATLAPFLDREGGGWIRPVVWTPALLGVAAFIVGLT
jgi:hypothetical protein